MPSVGLAQATLLAQSAVFGEAAAANKISPMGTLGLLLNGGQPKILSQNVDLKNGYIRDVNIRSKKRAAAGTTVTTDGCTVEAEAAYYTQTMPSLMKRYKGIWFDIPTIQQFQEDALKMVNAPGASAPTMVQSEVMDTLMTHINGILLDINADCVAAISNGKNAVTGLTTAKNINFPLNTTNLALGSGMEGVLNDMQFNEVNFRNAAIVGSGKISSFYNLQAVKGLDQAGVNSSLMSLPKFYYDPEIISAFAADDFLVVENGALQFLNVCYNRVALLDGKKFGTSTFFTIKVPVADALGNSFRELEFDVQVIEMDCPSDVTIGEDEPAAKGRGYKFIIGCHYTPVQLPDTAYEASDRLTGVNGVFRYHATNT